MMLSCPACSARLRVRDDLKAGPARAKCPRCGGWVPLSGTTGTLPGTTPPAIRVECTSCGAKLKAPAASAGAQSRCPRCRARILIQPEGQVGIAARSSADDSSGAATRRIDQRALGLPDPVQTSQTGVDLDAFLKGGEPSRPAPETSEGGLAGALLNPPVVAMQKIAGEIRTAAAGFEAATGSGHEPVGHDTAEPRTRPPLQPPRSSTAVKGATHAQRVVPTAYRSATEAFPSGWGLLLGAIAGLLVGLAPLALSRAIGPNIGRFLAPLPQALLLPGLREIVLRAALTLVLGGLAGFLAAAAGSPGRQDRPLRLLRCGGFALLVGLACGLVVSLLGEAGLKVWPISSWMRDLLLVGLLTTGLGRLVPATRS